MADLLQALNEFREETISKHYAAAFCELKEKVVNEPLRTIFYIYSGCVSKDIANEIAYRFIKNGIKAKVSNTLMQTYFLEVEVSLPEKLVHKQEVSNESSSETVATSEN